MLAGIAVRQSVDPHLHAGGSISPRAHTVFRSIYCQMRKAAENALSGDVQGLPVSRGGPGGFWCVKGPGLEFPPL